MQRIKPLAIYLPQFHPTPENDGWWGKGFTEWTNVTKARPLFRGHYQPHLPTDFGFYDLRCKETHLDQITTAKAHRIYGFAYYHYWFAGKRLLHRPIDLVLANKDIDFPFCFFWANETWSRRWLGEEKDVLVEQTYDFDDDRNHIQWLIQAFRDERYITVGQRPVFIIYRPTFFPDITKTLDIFRSECRLNGVPEPYFIGSNSHAGVTDLRGLGFDAVLDFQPQLGCLQDPFNDSSSWSRFVHNARLGVFSTKLKVYDYSVANRLMRRDLPYPYMPCTFVGWDNSPRRGRNGIIMANSAPAEFGRLLKQDIDTLQGMGFSTEENFLFINAWNEWAEGNHLEPDVKYGTAFLQQIRRALSEEPEFSS